MDSSWNPETWKKRVLRLLGRFKHVEAAHVLRHASQPALHTQVTLAAPQPRKPTRPSHAGHTSGPTATQANTPAAHELRNSTPAVQLCIPNVSNCPRTPRTLGWLQWYAHTHEQQLDGFATLF